MYSAQDVKEAIKRLLGHTDMAEHRQMVHPHNDVAALSEYLDDVEQSVCELVRLSSELAHMEPPHGDFELMSFLGKQGIVLPECSRVLSVIRGDS